jgi:hypothetical protein
MFSFFKRFISHRFSQIKVTDFHGSLPHPLAPSPPAGGEGEQGAGGEGGEVRASTLPCMYA